jgi:hypothetical protein
MIRSIEIQPVLNGFIVKVGCQILVFDSRTELLTNLRLYLENSEDTERRFMRESLNTGQLGEGLRLTETAVNQVPSPYEGSRDACEERISNG